MADSDPPANPEEAPMHHDVDERFTSFQVGAAAVLGVAAIVAGIVAGLVFSNT